MSNCIEKGWGGVEPTPSVSKGVKMNRDGLTPPHSHRKWLKKGGVGLNSPCSCQKQSKVNGEGSTPPYSR